MRSTPTKRRRAGFTLLEAMIAAGVLAVGIVGVVGLQARLFRSAAYSHDMSRAAYLLQYREEEIGAYSVEKLDTNALCLGTAFGCAAGGVFAAAPASGCSVMIDDPQQMQDPQPVPAGAFRLDTGIVNHGDANHPNARIATISVCWTDQGGRVRQLQTQRVVADR